MRIIIHDYGGYTFPVQLSRELSCRGHTILHIYSASNQPLKRGALSRKPDDPASFNILGLEIRKPFKKYSFLQRRAQEIEYGRLLARQLTEFQPDIIISANAPLDCQSIALNCSRQINAKFFFWLQDIVGLATHRILKRRLPVFGEFIGRYYISLERRLLHASDKIIVIAEDFLPQLHSWGISPEKTTVIPNWAPFDEISPKSKANPWSKKHKLADKFCFLFTGILGMKHDPALLLKLASHFKNHDDVQILVISEGTGADWLIEQKVKFRLDTLTIMNFQSYHDYPYVLGSGDVLLSILNSDAGKYSVPSKVLAYLCAKRPLLLAIPPENTAARLVHDQQMGLIVPPTDSVAFVQAAEVLKENNNLRQQFADNAYRYAETHFDRSKIGDIFENLLL